MIHSVESLYFSTARENLFRGSTVGALQGSCWVAELCSESKESAFCARDRARRDLNCNPLHNFRQCGLRLVLCCASYAGMKRRETTGNIVFLLLLLLFFLRLLLLLLVEK